MDCQEIKIKLTQNHQVFLDFIQSLSDEKFIHHKENKWTAGQQLVHIYMSVKPLNTALSLPKFSLGLLFGKANRPSKTYDELVNRYHAKLENGGVATARFSPKEVPIKEREKWLKLVANKAKKINDKLDGFSEKNLDSLILPHPLLGKLTLREMMYFTIYHVEHHLAMTVKNLEQK
jgi:hypothetical protein